MNNGVTSTLNYGKIALVDIKETTERTISVSVNDEAMGSAYIEEEGTTSLEGLTGAVKLVAVANEGYEFVNWTLDGEVVGTESTIYDTTAGDKAYVANFATRFAVTINPTTGGFLTVKQGERL